MTLGQDTDPDWEAAGAAPRVYLAVGDPGGADREPLLDHGPDALVLDAASVRAEGAASLLAGPRRPAIFVEIASLSAADAALDLVMPLRPAGIVLRGCVGLRDLDHLSVKLAVREAELDLADGSTRIVAVATDTAASVLALASFAGERSARLVGLGCDLDRLRAELRCRDDAPALRLAAGTVVTAAAAARVPAIAVFRGEAGTDARLGFDRLRGQGFRAVLIREAAELEAARQVFDGP